MNKGNSLRTEEVDFLRFLLLSICNASSALGKNIQGGNCGSLAVSLVISQFRIGLGRGNLELMGGLGGVRVAG